MHHMNIDSPLISKWLTGVRSDRHIIGLPEVSVASEVDPYAIISLITFPLTSVNLNGLPWNW
jgi:hypothetical protein